MLNRSPQPRYREPTPAACASPARSRARAAYAQMPSISRTRTNAALRPRENRRKTCPTKCAIALKDKALQGTSGRLEIDPPRPKNKPIALRRTHISMYCSRRRRIENMAQELFTSRGYGLSSVDRASEQRPQMKSGTRRPSIMSRIEEPALKPILNVTRSSQKHVADRRPEPLQPSRHRCSAAPASPMSWPPVRARCTETDPYMQGSG